MDKPVTTPNTITELIKSVHIQVAGSGQFRRFQRLYENDRIAFVYDCMPTYANTLAIYQEEILGEYDSGVERLAVRGPHGLGKTWLAGTLVHHTILTTEADCKVPTTASAWRQLDKYLWPEIWKISKALDWTIIGREPYDLRQEMFRLSIRLNGGLVEAFAAASDDHTTIEGAHATIIFYIFDEAKTIPRATWDAAEGAFSSGGLGTIKVVPDVYIKDVESQPGLMLVYGRKEIGRVDVVKQDIQDEDYQDNNGGDISGEDYQDYKDGYSSEYKDGNINEDNSGSKDGKISEYNSGSNSGKVIGNTSGGNEFGGNMGLIEPPHSHQHTSDDRTTAPPIATDSQNSLESQKIPRTTTNPTTITTNPGTTTNPATIATKPRTTTNPRTNDPVNKNGKSIATFGKLDVGISKASAFAISTPGEPSGQFYDIHMHKPGYEDWKTRHVTIDEAIRAGRISAKWAAQRERQWGRDSAVFQNRVLGEFSDLSEEGIIPLSWVRAATQRWLEWRSSGMQLRSGRDVLGVDVARGGEAKTVVVRRIGWVVESVWVYSKLPTTATAGHVKKLSGSGRSQINIEMDGGLGAAVFDMLREEGVPNLRPITVSSSTYARDKSGELGFLNVRTAMWWNMRELLDPINGVGLCLPPIDELITDLATPKWEMMKDATIKLEEKKDIIKRLKRSTDYGDALCLAFWTTGVGGGVVF
jgi:hypothetical protein